VQGKTVFRVRFDEVCAHFWFARMFYVFVRVSIVFVHLFYKCK